MSRSLEPGKLGDWLLHVMHERVGKAENFAGIVGVRSCRQSQARDDGSKAPINKPRDPEVLTAL